MWHNRKAKLNAVAACSVVTLMAFGIGNVSAQQGGSSTPQQPSAGSEGRTGSPAQGGGSQASPGGAGSAAQGGQQSQDTKQGGGAGQASGATKGDAQTKSGAAKQSPEADGKRAQQGQRDDGKAEKKGRADAAKEESGKKQSADRDRDEKKGKREDKRASEKSEKNDRTNEKSSQSDTQKSPTGDKAGTGQAQTKEGTGQPGAAGQQQQTSPRQTTEREGASPRRAELGENERVQFRQTIIQERNAPRVNRPSFNVSIGVRVPRDVRLAPLPASVISIAPAYRGYQYFVVDERIVIIEPSTYEIVEVIDEGRGPSQKSRGQTASIDLSPNERQVVLRLVRSDVPRANVNIGLALGAEVPRTVELIEFPSSITSEITELRDYRYVLVEDSVVVVNPDNRVIVLVVRG